MDDPDATIVIVGVGCRLPGAENLDEFWRVLCNGENHVIDIPRDRWNVDAFYDADPDAPGKTYVRKVGIVKDHDKFDNRLFDINEIEAAKMDPQQKFALESTFMAMEDGGFTRSQLSGSKTGVYMGVMNSDYADILTEDLKEADNYTMTGGAPSIVAARISYVFDLRGPALCVDTACSSALIAIHLGSQALLMGDCNMAICGGVNCILSPKGMMPLSKARMVSPTGSSKAFSAEADGYARGEGCGIVILKKIRDAEANGDKIWAIIKTGSNQDGRMVTPITAPSGQQQQRLLEETYTRYEIKPQDIQVIEAHGTGTPVGDPIEANSLGAFFGKDGTNRFIGSVKTNIGHLEAAAGLAGMLKVLLMMQKAKIVPSLHCVNTNTKIDFEKCNFEVPTECNPWEPLPDGRRMACVNAFGFGGSNGHAIVIQPPSYKKEPTTSEDGHIIITISGHSKGAFKANVTHLLKSLAVEDVNPRRLSYTTTCRRDHYNYRLAVPMSEGDDLEQTLKKATLGNFEKLLTARKKIQLVYVFGGMGTTWDGMCKNIMSKENRFLLKVREIDRILKKYCTVSIEDELQKQTNYTDPMIGPLILFACQVALFGVWKAWGVKPQAIVGQSVGEVAAAYASGRLSLDDAVMVIFYRTELLTKATGGKMIVILNNPVSDVEERCAKYNGRLNVALYYSPSACAVSGDDDCVDAIEIEIQEEKQRSSSDIFLFHLKVTTAFHSKRMESLLTPLEQKIQGIKASEEQTNIFSTVTGKKAEDNDFVTPQYWVQNLRQPVLFHQALLEVRDKDYHTVFIEIGPKSILGAHLENIFGDKGVEILSSMEKGSDMCRMLKSLCELYAIGFNPAWENIIPLSDHELTNEPKYQFQRTKLLFEPDVSRRYRDGTETRVQDHLFVNRAAGDIPTFRVNVNERQTPFVFEHVVNGVNLVPGTFYVEVGLVVGYDVLRMPVQSLSISAHYVQPLNVQPGQEYVLTCQVQNVTSTSLSFTVYNQNSIYAHGHVKKRESRMISITPIFSKIKPRCKTVQNHVEIYKSLAQSGFSYGQGLQILCESFSNSTETFATIECTELINSQMRQTHFHPSVLDAMMQATSTIAVGSILAAETKAVLPSGLGSVMLYQPLEKDMLCYAKKMKILGPKLCYNLLLMTAAGALVAEVKDAVIQIVGENTTEAERVSYKLCWMPDSKVRPKDLDGTQKAIVICDDSSTICDFVGTSEKLMFKCCKASSHHFDIQEVKNALLIADSSNRLILRKEVVAIIFNQGAHVFSDNLTSDDIFSTISQTCNKLRKLFLLLSEYEMSIPVTIVTRATQSLCGKPNDDVVNIFGSQLWGMVRSMIKEYIYPYIQLLDISDNSPETLATFVDHITDLNMTANLGKEVLIRKGKVYTSSVKFSRETEPSLLAVEQKWNKDDEVRIVQISEQNIDLCMYHSQISRPEHDHARVNVQNVLLHKESIFPTTLAANNHIWKDISTKESQLLCLEAKGYQETSTGRTEIILCTPVEVSNIVNVPNECIVQQSAVPCYKVGLMTLLLFAWQLYETVDQHSRAIFVIDNSSIEFAQMMKGILFLFGIENTECLSSACIDHIKICKNTVLIILADLENQELDRVAVASELKQIIGIEGYNGFATFESCFLKHITAQLIPIETKQVFHLSRIKNNLPKILSKISQKRYRFEKLFSHINQEHFAGFSHGYLDLEDTHQLKVMTTAESLFRKNASYLVVGGLGGLGWLTVRLIAEMGGGLIATLSRSLPSEDMAVKIENLKQDTSVEITCLQADISDEISLQNAFNRLSKDFPGFPLKGIFQGAGVLEDAFLVKMTRESFDRVCKPKILGTYNLHKISLKYDLDYFVMHSSIASIAGNAGQTNYASGNSFMDTFAYHRRSKGLPGQAINWGPLEVGMASSEQILQLLKKNGFVPLTEEQIKSCLVYSLLINVVQICYMDFGWIKKQRQLYLAPDIRPLMMNEGAGLVEGDFNVRQIDMAANKLLPPSERFDAMFDYFNNLIGQVLSIDSDGIQKDTELSYLGLDSLLAMTLVNQIHRDWNVRMSLEKVLKMNTVEQLVSFLEELVLSQNKGDIDMVLVSAQSLISEMSPNQEIVYQNHLKWKGERDCVYTAEINCKLPVTLSQPVQWMTELIITILERHESLRTIFVAEDEVTRPRVLKDLSDVSRIPLQSNDPEELTKEITKLSKRPFDLSKEIPIRFICGYSEGQHNLGFVFHSICFDLKSIQLFFEDFKQVALAKARQINPHPVPKNNVPYEIQTILWPQVKNLERFWNSRINKQSHVSLISFSDEDTKSEDVFGFKHFVGAQLSADVRLKMDYLLSQWSVTLFQFLTSAYQLLLHLVSGNKKVALSTCSDIRMYVTKIRDTITLGVNEIPLVAEINPIHSIEKFVKSNATEISHRVSCGLYPWNKIMEKTTAETTANVHRHTIVSEDMTEIYSTTQGLDFVTFKTNGAVNMDSETRLLIWLQRDDKNLRLQLDYLPSLITKSKAENLLRSLSDLVNYMASNPQERIKTIPIKMKNIL